MSSPVLLIGGSLDTAPPPGRLESIASELKANGKAVELQILQAGHGFSERRHTEYDERASADAWKYTLEFLRKYSRNGSSE